MLAHASADRPIVYPGPPGVTPSHHGPQHCSPHTGPTLGRLASILDEIDYGIVVLDLDGRVRHANYRARAELQTDHPLRFEQGRLKARSGWDNAAFNNALHAAAHRGLRRLIEMSCRDERISVAIVPLTACAGESPEALLVLMGRRHICEDLSVQSFARASRLTGTETRVLEGLCNGASVSMIARSHGVAISTVRSHVASIRGKTGARTVQELVRRVAALPPLVSVLRSTESFDASPQIYVGEVA